MNWVDTYYVDYKYYPEFLHLMLKIRNFLTYFLSSKSLESRGYFFSHFDIFKSLGSLYFRVYVYDGRLESFKVDALNLILKKRFRFGKRVANQHQKLFYPYIIFKLFFRDFSFRRATLNDVYFFREFAKSGNKYKLYIRIKNRDDIYCMSALLSHISLFKSIEKLLSLYNVSSIVPKNLILSSFIFLLSFFR